MSVRVDEGDPEACMSPKTIFTHGASQAAYAQLRLGVVVLVQYGHVQCGLRPELGGLDQAAYTCRMQYMQE
jgi:hypothetical protein